MNLLQSLAPLLFLSSAQQVDQLSLILKIKINTTELRSIKITLISFKSQFKMIEGKLSLSPLSTSPPLPLPLHLQLSPDADALRRFSRAAAAGEQLGQLGHP